MKIKLSVLLFVLLSSTKVLASTCLTLYPNTSAKIETETAAKCIKVKHVNPGNTFFIADRAYQVDAGYNVNVRTVNYQTILSASQQITDRPTMEVLDTLYNTELVIQLNPTSIDKKFSFYILHDEDTINNRTTIYVGLSTEPIETVVPSPAPDLPCHLDPFCEPPPCDGCLIESIFTPSSVYTTSKRTLVHRSKSDGRVYDVSSSGLSAEAAECNDANRPPSPPPVHRTTGNPLNINAFLRETEKWTSDLTNVHGLSNGSQDTAIALRMVVMHDIGGALDVAHDPNSDFEGSEAMGNFLFALNGRAMGMSLNSLLSFSAGFQSISDGTGYARGIRNYILNTGDGSGDIEIVTRADKYFNEVYSNNKNDSDSLSCVDSQTIAANNNATPPTSGVGNNIGMTSVVYGGAIGIGSGRAGGTEWCFVDSRGIVQYCWMEY